MLKGFRFQIQNLVTYFIIIKTVIILLLTIITGFSKLSLVIYYNSDLVDNIKSLYFFAFIFNLSEYDKNFAQILFKRVKI